MGVVVSIPGMGAGPDGCVARDACATSVAAAGTTMAAAARWTLPHGNSSTAQAKRTALIMRTANCA